MSSSPRRSSVKMKGGGGEEVSFIGEGLMGSNFIFALKSS